MTDSNDWSVSDPSFPAVKKKYGRFTLEHPWGNESEKVRLVPPVEVPTFRIQSNDVFVCVVSKNSKVCKRRLVRGQTSRYLYGDMYPEAFVAWDEDAQEYALHQRGDDSVAPLTKRRETWPPFIRGESETVGGEWDRKKRRRRSFKEWFLGKSEANEVPDFLRARREETE